MKKNILIALILIVLSVIGFMFFSGGDEQDSLLVSQNTGSTAIGAEILSALTQLGSLKLDEDIFEDRVFKSLVNFSKPIQPQPVGRPNPFAPISSTATNAPRATTTTSSATPR